MTSAFLCYTRGMKIRDDGVSFQSKIKFIDTQAFKSKIAGLSPKKHYVGYPWTPDTMKKGKNLYTTSIMDCIAGGIVDNNSVTMFHLCTRSRKDARNTRQKGFDIKNIERRILEKIDTAKENLHAFILGGFQLEPDSKYNVNKLNKIEKIFEKHEIPYSILGARRDVHYFGRYSIFYCNKEDTWYVTNGLASPEPRGNTWPKLQISGSSVIYDTYAKIMHDNKLSHYQKTTRTSDVEGYFKSQFRKVSLSRFDEFA